MAPTAAGLGSQSQGSGSLAATSLRATENQKRLTLRGPGSPYARPMHYASPSADGSSIRIAPGAACGVPGSPRSSCLNSPRTSPRNSPRCSAGGASMNSSTYTSLRGQPAGKVVECVRQAFSWPHARGSDPSQLALSNASATMQELDDTSRSLGIGSLQLARMSYGKSATEVTALPAQDVLASMSVLATHGLLPVDAEDPTMISAVEANVLADVAAAEAELEAQRIFQDELPPSPEPLYADNPWRLGLTARSKERGARRIFPCFMITPHAIAGSAGASRGAPAEARPLGRNASIGTNSSAASPTIIPPETSGLEPPYQRILPSSTVSMSSTAELLPDNEICEPLPQASSRSRASPGAPPPLASRPKWGVSPRAALSPRGAASPRSASGPTLLANEAAKGKASRQTLQRSPAGAFPSAELGHATAEAAAAAVAPAQQKPREAGSATARLSAIRARLEKNLQSAEDGLNNDLRKLDGRLVGRPATSGGATAA